VRRAKSKVQAVYPELARKMNITGTVKVQVVVSPNGTVKEAKVDRRASGTGQRCARCHQEMAV
jgi:outer membrane biosynthesis protein TonB